MSERGSRVAVLLLALLLTGCGSSATEGAGALGPTAATAPPGAAAAEAFLDLSRSSSGAAVLWASRVGYSMSGVEVGVIRPGHEATSLLACPTGQSTYEGRDCPVSPLTTLAVWARDGGNVMVEPGAPRTVGCSTTRTPRAVADLLAVTLRPPASARDCFSDFAVTLYLDGDDRVAWVDFTLSGP